MKLALLTFHNAMNYGAILKSYALQTYLTDEFNCEVTIVNYTPAYFKKVFFNPMKPLTACGLKNKLKSMAKLVLRYRETKNISLKEVKLKEFISKNLNTSQIVYKPIEEESYDAYVVGSDQVWNLELLQNDLTYLLDFVTNTRKISYATSFKISDVDEFALNAYKKFLPTFDFISVRERNLSDYLAQIGITSTSVLDPTLLIDSKFWMDQTDSCRLIRKRYLLLYYVNLPDRLVSEAFEYANKNNLIVVSLNSLHNHKGYIDYSYASIEQFLNLSKYADAIFTTSFHGFVFSIIFQKKMYFEVPQNSYNNNERLLDLANKLELSNRNLSKGLIDDDIDWNSVEHLLKKYREISGNYLKDALSV